MSRNKNFPIFDGSQEYCLWLGCMGAYDPRGREIVTAFAAVMQHLGTSFGVLKKERCTGDPVRRLGNDLLLQQLAEANLAALSRPRSKRSSPSAHIACVRCKVTGASTGLRPPIEHHSEFMARHSASLPAKQDGQRVVSITILAIWDAIGASMTNRGKSLRFRPTSSNRREIASDPSAAGQAADWCSSAKRPASESVMLGPKNSPIPEPTWSARPARSATACFGTRWRDVARHPPRLLDIAQIVAEQLEERPSINR